MEKPEQAAPGSLGTLTSLAVAAAIIVALYVGREVLVPIALAILLSFMLAPVVQLLRRAHLGRVPAVFAAVIMALGLIVAVGGLIGMQMSQLAGDLPRYATTIEQKVSSVGTFAVRQLAGVSEILGRHPVPAPAAPAAPVARPSARGPAPVAEAPKPTQVELRPPEPTPFELAEKILTPVVAPLATTAIVFVVAIFILLQQTDLRDRFIRLFGLLDMHRTTRALDDAARRLSRYLLILLGLNLSFGVVIGFGLLLIGVPHPFLWGALSALFRFVPYIGSVLAGLLPATLAAAVDPGWAMAVETAALFVVVETVMGQFIDPLAYGRSTGLSPLSVIIAAIFWSWMWGPVGLILSMPLTVCLVVLGRHVQRLEFLDVLMGDRPALTAVESFYQRILANDPDEALEYAENLLKDRPLSTYYDEVAIKGLQLAATDAERGMLSEPVLERIQAAMSRLIDELDDFTDIASPTAVPQVKPTSGVHAPAADAAPGPANPDGIVPGTDELTGRWSGPEPVLCIAGGGPLDLPVADMLVQLLTKNGLGARAVPFAQASRETIGSLNLEAAAVVCLCYLDMSLRPSQLRYLVQRVRRIAPHMVVIAGLWPGEDAEEDDGRLLAAVGADYAMASLRDGVNICLARARA